MNTHDPVLAKLSDASAIRARFAHVDTWVFDLDNTLYPPGSDLWPRIDQRITHYLADMFGIDGLSARALQKYYYLRHGTTLKGLMDEHAIDANQFLAFVHDIDRSGLAPNAALGEALSVLPGRKLILTNGSREHALRTLEQLGIHGHFDDIFDIAAGDLIPKPEAATFDRFFRRHDVDPGKSAMFEDLERNLVVPHERGMVTTLVVPPLGQTDHREAVEKTAGDSPSVDFVTSDLGAFLLNAIQR